MFAREGSRDPMQTTDVGSLVKQTVDLVERRYETHGIALKTILPVALPLIKCREVQIGQVLLNLLNNAFDAIDSSEKSERWVTVQAEVRHSGESDAAMMVIEVIDGGPGVAPEHRPHLMEAFYTTKPVGAGIGVGLSLSQAIAHDHGGTLNLAEVDGHTCFQLTLPLNAAEEEGSAA
jgi:C4-dicarboxylate-specific signal transduction histidine kinase